jgi:tetratricopeptide (TPR) repeat protein
MDRPTNSAKENQPSMKLAGELLGKQRYRRACSEYARLAVKLTPQAEGVAQCGLARALKGLGNYEEAATHCVAAIQAAPANSQGYDILGGILDYLSHPDEVIGSIQRVIDRSRTWEGHQRWAQFLHDKDRPWTADLEYAKAARRHKNEPATLVAWGKCLTALGRHEEALRRYESALGLAHADTQEVFDALSKSLRALKAPDDHVERIAALVDDRDTAAMRLAWGHVLAASGHRDLAAVEYEKILATTPDHLEARVARAKDLASRRLDEEALAQAEQLIGSHPDDPAAFNLGIDLLRQMGDATKGVARLQRAVDGLDNTAAHARWGQGLAELQKHELAIREFEKASQKDAAPELYVYWAESLNALGRHEEAALTCMTGFEKHPSAESPTLDMLGVLLAEMREPSATLRAIETRVAALNTFDAHAGWARVLATADRPEAAAASFGRAHRLEPSAGSIAFDWAQVLTASGRHDQALSKYADIVLSKTHDPASVFPAAARSLQSLDVTRDDLRLRKLQESVDLVADAHCYVEWGRALSGLKHFQAAAQQFAAASRDLPDNPELQVEWGKALVGANKIEEGTARYLSAVEMSSGDPAVVKQALDLFREAVALLESDEQAIARFQTAFDSIEGAFSFANWADVLNNIGHHKTALEMTRRALDLNPGDAVLRSVYAYRLIEARQEVEGLREFRLAEERKPDIARIRYHWGLSLATLGRHADAIEKFRQAAERDENYGYFDWALALERLGLHDEARAKYLLCMSKTRDHYWRPYCLHNIASILERQGDFGGARKAWARALEAYKECSSDAQASKQGDYFMYWGSVHHGMLRNYAEAARLYAKALEINPKSVNALGSVARLHTSIKENAELDDAKRDSRTENHWSARQAYVKASMLLERTLAEFPIASTSRDLAVLHLGMAEYKKAKDVLLPALERGGDTLELLDLLGRACIGTEEFGEAVRHCRAAVDRDPENLDFRLHLAEGYLKSRSLDKAEAEYRHVLSVAAYHVDALLGLGKTCVSLGDEFQKAGRTSDAENAFSRAAELLSQAAEISGKDHASRQLSPVEKAAVSYSRGYAFVMRYEAQTLAKRDQKLLDAALRAFDEVPPRDANHHKAQRAKAKILEQIGAFEGRAARWGGRLISVGAIVTFFSAQVAFWGGKPGWVKTYRITEQAILALKAAKVPDEVVAKLETAAKRERAAPELPATQLRSVLGDEATTKYGNLLDSVAAGPLLRWGESIETGYYALLSFGSLMFMIIGGYLQQLSKLKFGGIELEKTSEAATKVSASMGITL